MWIVCRFDQLRDASHTVASASAVLLLKSSILIFMGAVVNAGRAIRLGGLPMPSMPCAQLMFPKKGRKKTIHDRDSEGLCSRQRTSQPRQLRLHNALPSDHRVLYPLPHPTPVRLAKSTTLTQGFHQSNITRCAPVYLGRLLAECGLKAVSPGQTRLQ